MNPAQIQRLALWHFPVGTVARIQVYAHWSLLLVAAHLLWTFRHAAQLGLLAVLTLWGSVFLHELGHCFAARQQGGRADKVVLWLLGGLAECEVDRRPWPQFVVAIWGPLVNLALAGLAIAILLTKLEPGEWLLPWGPYVAVDGLGFQALELVAKVNLVLAAFNLIPAFPLDGGRVFHAALWSRQGFVRAMRTTIVLAYVCAVLLAVLALTLAERDWLLFGAALFVGIGAYGQRQALEAGLLDDHPAEASWERSAQAYERAREPEPEPGAIQRWREERAARQEEQEAARKLELRRRLDEVLAKVSEVGMQGLSPEEKAFLQEASAELRKERE